MSNKKGILKLLSALAWKTEAWLICCLKWIWNREVKAFVLSYLTFLGWNIGLNSCNTKDLYGNFIFCLNAYHLFIYVQGCCCDSTEYVLLISLLHKLFCLSCNLLKGSISIENTNSSCFDISPKPLKQ